MEAKRTELLSPAGDMERLTMALTYGADAVYLAGNMFGMRAAAGYFDRAEMAKATTLAHSHGVKVYVTCNTVPRNDEAALLPEFLESVSDCGVDALIVADIGVVSMAKKYAPSVPLHVSTQAGIANYATASAFYDLGAKRAVLARELTLDEIAVIRAHAPKELELEVFVHGSMCVSFSGRCLLSNYLTGRDANRGECAQPCRWKYHLVEERRPGEYLEISEDNGTFILNSRDLCMIEHLRELIDAGVDSLKIEGRMKSAYYAAAVTNAYRHALDDALRGRPFNPVWRSELDHISHREYSTGFFYDSSGPGQYYSSSMYFSDCYVAAMVENCEDNGTALLSQRNKFSVGDPLSLLTPNSEPVPFIAGSMTDMDGNEISSTPHPMMKFKMKLPIKASANSFIRKINTVSR